MFRKKKKKGFRDNKLRNIIENCRKQKQAENLKIDKNIFNEKEIEIINDIVNKEIVSFTYIKKKFSLNYTKTANVLDKLEANNIISPPINIKKNTDRYVLINKNNSYLKEEESYHEKINRMSGEVFEMICADLLQRNGFKNISLTKATGDYGVDILAEKDSVKYAIQCKRYNQPVGNKAVQEAYSGKKYYNCHVAVVLTNSTFTDNAKELAKSNGVLLWDKDKLDELITEGVLE